MSCRECAWIFCAGCESGYVFSANRMRRWLQLLKYLQISEKQNRHIDYHSLRAQLQNCCSSCAPRNPTKASSVAKRLCCTINITTAGPPTRSVTGRRFVRFVYLKCSWWWLNGIQRVPQWPQGCCTSSLDYVAARAVVTTHTRASHAGDAAFSMLYFVCAARKLAGYRARQEELFSPNTTTI